MSEAVEEASGKPDSVSEQVVRRLLDRINERQLRPGDVFDSEMQVARELAVSRGSVREAFRILATLGVLQIGNGRRPRVHGANATALTRIFGHVLQIAQATPLHVLEFRRGVETRGAQLAAHFASEQQLATLRRLVADMRSAIDDDLKRSSCDLAIHTTLAEASNNPLNTLVLTALQAAIVQSLRDDCTVHNTRPEIIRIVDAHEAIVDRVCARDPVGAGAAMAAHFDLSVNALLRNPTLRGLS